MATYKVIQDIEAEDKLVGPLGIRQFVYAIIVVVSLFIGFQLAVSVSWMLAIPLLPHTIFFALLAAPLGGQQSSEVWLLAKIRFMIKPRVRVWNQSGVQELVTITAPKKIEKVLTKDLSQTEVKSRLKALANTIDSRGWAVKNVNTNLFAQPAYAGMSSGSDRLVDTRVISQQAAAADLPAADDMLDEQNNLRAQNLDRMMNDSAVQHKEKIKAAMHQPQATNPAPQTPPQSPSDTSTPVDTTHPDYWFLNANAGAPTPALPGQATFQKTNIVTPQVPVPPPQPVPDPSQPPAPLSEEELLEKIHTEQKNKPKKYGNMRVIKPVDEQQAEQTTPEETQPADEAKAPMTPQPDPAILELANNDDLNVATIARQAHKKTKRKDNPPDGEVVISLH